MKERGRLCRKYFILWDIVNPQLGSGFGLGLGFGLFYYLAILAKIKHKNMSVW